MRSFCFFIIFSFASVCFSTPNRITEISFDLSKVYRLKLYPARPSLIEFPCAIKFALPGNKDDIAVTVGVDKRNQLILTVSSFRVKPTNLIVHCGEDNYVFDVTPSHKSHRDFINIVNSYRENDLRKYKLLDSSSSVVPKKQYKFKKLISSSKDKEE